MEALERARYAPGFGLFFEQGCGKTATAINILRAKCFDEGRLLNTLIVCPPVVRQNWKREIHQHSNIKEHQVVVLDGSGKQRLKKFLEASEKGPAIFITNYEVLGLKSMGKLFSAIVNWRPDMLILDESHKIKKHNTKRTQGAIQLADQVAHKLILTGTPILNDGQDIWAQFRVLDGGKSFEKNFYVFQKRYFYDKNANSPAHVNWSDWAPRPGIEEEFNRLIHLKSMRVLKKECLDLPPFVRKRLYVDLEPDQARAYKSMEKDFIAYIEGEACVASIALTKMLRLQQIVSGFYKTDEGEEKRFKKNPRLELIEELVSTLHKDHKVIIWTSFRESYAPILEILKKMGVESRTIVGGMTDKKRNEAIDAFQNDDKVRVVVANAAAGGTGVNLTAASFAIYYSRTWSLEQDLQSEARCHRGGSEVHESITRIDLVSPGTVDEEILEALARKENLAEKILKRRKRGPLEENKTYRPEDFEVRL